MHMKQHILAALREEFEQWEELLASRSEQQITTPNLPGDMSIKDSIAHVMAWQQRSIARLEAAVLNREPEFPAWPAVLNPDSEDTDTTDYLNAWIYESHHQTPWTDVQRDWRTGFLRFLELGAAVSEKDLLDSSRYPWLNGYPLAFILIASYDHYQEHLEKLQG
ncbi:MAG: ClbS/DfsB family four-helix bundle protein [Roseiflexaceae bacterium]|nr:ClbS/DfsB family four-helix bundle protein [Roseiflexaceae bacterium]